MNHLLLIISNLISSISIIALNKHLFTALSFKFPFILTCLHFLVTWICLVMVFFRDNKKDLLPQPPYDLIISISIGRVFSILTMNLNLKYNSVAIYQLSKIAILPVTFLLLRNRSTREEMIGVFMATIGVLFATVRDPYIESDGVYIAIVAVFTSTISIMLGERVKRKGFNALQVMRREMPLSTLLIMLMIPFTEERVSDAVVCIQESSTYIVTIILLTCTCAAVINSTAFMMITRIGPVSYLMCGHVKTLLILCMGFYKYYFFDTSEKENEILFFVMWSLFAFLGVLLYSRSRMMKKDDNDNNDDGRGVDMRRKER